MRRYALIYLLVLATFFALETTPWAQDFTVGTWTRFLADVSGGLMHWFDDRVVVQGSNLRNGQTGYAVSIKAGCNGVEAAMILAAAIQVLNIIRIISLYYLGEWSVKALNIAHLYVWPGLIILDALIIFLIWMHWLGKPNAKPALS